MKKLKLLILVQSVIVIVSLLEGCASSASSHSFPRTAARTSFDVYYGEVISVREVEIEGESTILGNLGGSVIGAALGRGDGGWYGDRGLETAVGAVAGAVVGEAVERKIKSENALEVIVVLDTEETIAVVQAADVSFSAGDRVQVLYGRDGSTRVQPL